MIYKRGEINSVADNINDSGMTLVLATGFFDALHEEHKKFLSSAKRVGDILIVAVESDARARILKGEGRPIQTQEMRAIVLDNLPFVDHIVLLNDNFDNDREYEQLIKDIKPDIYAVSENTDFQSNKRQLVTKHGGVLQVVHKYNPLVSTTKNLEKITSKT